MRLFLTGLLLVCLFVIPSNPAHARQAEAVLLGPVVNVSAGNGPISRAWAYADPSDARYLMACGGQFDPGISGLLSGFVYISSDGGGTWSRTLRDNSEHWVSEESCTFGSSGHAYYAAGVSDPTTHIINTFDFGHLHVYASDDHGLTWGTPWIRSKGWVDWTHLQAIPVANGPEKVVLFGYDANNGPGHHWVTKHPVALESIDGGRSFSDVVTSSQPQGYQLFHVFAGGSTLLPDGDVLFSASAAPPNIINEPDAVFVFSPSMHTLSYRSFIRTSPFLTGFAVHIVQDTSDGLSHGRLYSVGVETDRRNAPSVVWLATSNDRGYHWSSRIILRGSTSASPIAAHLAINYAGILGILWADTNANLFFASSADGGKTFGTTSTIATFPVTGDLLSSSTQAVPWDETFLSENLNTYVYGRPQFPDIDRSHLGLSIRMNSGQRMGNVQIVADVRGVFHAFWEQPDAQNYHSLLTRTITISASNVSATTPLLQLTQARNVPSVSLAVVLKLPTQAVVRWSARRFAVPGWPDISSSIGLDFKKPQYDAASHTITVDVTLINTGRRVIRRPLAFIGFGMHSDFGIPHARNAQRWIHGWPSWDVTPLLPASGLQPNGRSAPLRLEFQVANFRLLPVAPLILPLMPANIIAMHAGVYERVFLRPANVK